MPAALVIGQFEDLVSYGLRSVLSEDDRVEVLATNIPMSAMESRISEVEPDVAIIDYRALRSPVEVHQLAESQPETRIVVLVDRASAAECNQLLAFGATGVVTKDATKDDLLTAIHLAARGMRVMPGTGGSVQRETLGPDLLTDREAEVLELLQQGLSNAEIAARLTVGLETVRTHARNIYRKLGVSSRKDLAAAPMLRGR